MTEDLIASLRERLLDAALPDIAFDGWSSISLEKARAQAGISEDEQIIALPKGPIDLLSHFSKRGDQRMLDQLATLERPAKIRELVTLAVKTRLLVDAPHREAVRRGAAMLTAHPRVALRLSYATTDAVWRWVGDTSTDYNFYTKRAILSGVISATRLYWFTDESADFEESWAFLSRRIDNVMQFEKMKATTQSRWEGSTDRVHGAIQRMARWRFGQSS